MAEPDVIETVWASVPLDGGPAADRLCVCGHPESRHVPATPTQKVCVAVVERWADRPVCSCLDFEAEPEDDDG